MKPRTTVTLGGGVSDRLTKATAASARASEGRKSAKGKGKGKGGRARVAAGATAGHGRVGEDSSSSDEEQLQFVGLRTLKHRSTKRLSSDGLTGRSSERGELKTPEPAFGAPARARPRFGRAR